MSRSIRTCATAVALVALTACSSAYYKTMETFGYEKRDLLVGRVEGAQEAQQKAEEQFTDALEAFQSMVGYDGGDLEAVYDDLKDDYEDSAERAEAVRDRIADVKKVGNDLFVEWESELDEYSNDKLRRKSQEQLNQTRSRYDQLIGKMDAAADSMDPVLATLNDQVLFLKHNLNARALGSLEQTASELQKDVDVLIRDMRAAIAEGDRFLETIGGAGS